MVSMKGERVNESGAGKMEFVWLIHGFRGISNFLECKIPGESYNAC